MTEPVRVPVAEPARVPASEPPPPALRGVASYRQVTLQLLRFGLAGAFVFGVYTGGTLLLSGPVGLPIALAIAIAFPVALAINFTMQRHFVFLDHDTFALEARTQFARYLVAAVCNYVLTTVIVLTVPQAIGVSPQLVFVITAMVMSLLGFTIVRGWIFHQPSATHS